MVADSAVGTASMLSVEVSDTINRVPTIDLNRLTYREYREFIAAEGSADEIPILAKVVTAWQFAGDPSDPASYDNLGMLDLLAVQAALRAAVQEATANTGN